MPELTDATINKLVETLSTLSGNVQAAQQTSQQLNQLISDMAVKQSVGASTVSTQLETGETGFAENLQLAGVDRGTEVFKAWQKIFQDVATQSTKELAAINKATIEHLQNSVTAAQQANTNYNTHIANNNSATVKHGDIATNAQWNLEPSEGAAQTTVLRAVSLDDAALKAIGAMVAAAVADAVKPKA